MIKSFLAMTAMIALVLFAACSEEDQDPPPSGTDGPDRTPPQTRPVDRESRIPAEAVKMTPQTDKLPPQLHSDGWEEPVPAPYPVNTAGGEDSPFIMPDGNTLYFWFTPDVSLPAEKQVGDGVTGIYVSEKVNSKWQEPGRLILQDPGKLALDGCPFVQDGVIWFCTAREGYTGLHWFTAEYVDGEWTNWENADFNPEYEVGELHITSDGRELYFHSSRPGGKGENDIWVSQNVGGEWQPPENVEAVNSEADDSRPFVSEDGNELWFTRTYRGSPAVFRSQKVNGRWQEPELIISQFAAEPAVDNAGNIYFIHHFIEDGRMIEADVYVARKK